MAAIAYGEGSTGDLEDEIAGIAHAVVNIFGMDEITKPVVTYWQARNSKTGKIENTKERGRYDCVYRSTAAHGRTIFWRYTPEYVTATGAKEYK